MLVCSCVLYKHAIKKASNFLHIVIFSIQDSTICFEPHWSDFDILRMI